MTTGARLAAVFGAVAALVGAAPAAAQLGAADTRVLIVLHPGGVGPADERVFERFAERTELSFGLLGATQGPYSVRQTLLDITQGARLSISGYEPRSAPPMRLIRTEDAWAIARWNAARRRARSAPAKMLPGLLAGRIPGGGAYAGTDGPHTHVEAIVVADRRGRVAEASLGDVDDVATRARGLLGRHRLVVANLPRGRTADRQLDELIAGRREGELLIALRTPPRARAPQLLPMGAAGIAVGPSGLLTSRTTRRDGFVAGIDVLPAIFTHLGIAIPDAVRGRRIEVTLDKGRDAGFVRRLERRLRVVFPRRFPALHALLAALALTALMIGYVAGQKRRAMRLCGLALLWLPSLSLVTAALAPSLRLELIIVAAGAVALAMLTDRAVAWPRAPAVPAILGTVAYVADLAAGSPLIIRSLLGPNPRFGARFYGIGNELEAVLPVLALVAVAAAAGAALRSRRLALAFGATMLALGAAVGAGRLGADVGGVITIGAGGAAATVMALPGGPSRRAIVIACGVPFVALAALALVDVVTGGDSHFSSTVLGADDPAALWDIVQRRTTLAYQAFARGLMPIATIVAVAALVHGVRSRDRLLAPVAGHPAWAAMLAGGAAAGVVGSLANDSGPVLLVLGMVVMLAAALYIHGAPEKPGEPPAADIDLKHVERVSV